MSIHAEIQYPHPEGLGPIHSDICPPGCSVQNMDAEYRQFLHACLDEWLDGSDGEGFFYIGNNNDLIDNFREDD